MRHLRSTFPYLSRIHKTLTKRMNPTRGLTSTATAQEPAPPPPPPPATEKVTSIVEEISKLTLLEVSDLTEVLRNKLDIKEMPIMAVMMPGMGFSTGLRGSGPGSGGAKGGAEASKAEEKTVFDVKLEGYEAAGKIKVIKEVRGFTDLGLKEAKELVEKAPTLLKKGVTKEEAEKIIGKMKEVGAKVVME